MITWSNFTFCREAGKWKYSRSAWLVFSSPRHRPTPQSYREDVKQIIVTSTDKSWVLVERCASFNVDVVVDVHFLLCPTGGATRRSVVGGRSSISVTSRQERRPGWCSCSFFFLFLMIFLIFHLVFYKIREVRPFVPQTAVLISRLFGASSYFPSFFGTTRRYWGALFSTFHSFGFPSAGDFQFPERRHGRAAAALSDSETLCKLYFSDCIVAPDVHTANSDDCLSFRPVRRTAGAPPF